MTPELNALTVAALLQIIQFVLYAVPANRELGTGFTMSSRDYPPNNTMGKRTARLGRAFDNHFQGLALFTIAVLVLHLSEQTSGFTAICGWIYVIARIAYVPAYVLGLNPWRSIIWAAGFLATTLMLLAALF